MKEIKETAYKGTRILLGNEKRDMIDRMIDKARQFGFVEIHMPIIQLQEIFHAKVGEENQNMMFNFKDRGNRDVCLAPEYTAVIQRLAQTEFKDQKDVRVFYVQECFRGEKPQAGRYRQFTQFGMEVINRPVNTMLVEMMAKTAITLCAEALGERETYPFQLNTNITRGLDYYKDGKGFEITCEELGAQKQVCGGGEYEGGVGFAIGIDRLMLLKK